MTIEEVEILSMDEMVEILLENETSICTEKNDYSDMEEYIWYKK